jgi:spore photoproduct lyase
VAIDGLQPLEHNRKTILSWSLNTERIIASEERKTAPLAARLAAAKTAASWGYPLAFHFDPMVIYPGCEDEYREVIRQLFAQISARNVVWISLGTFRYMPSLKAVIQQRFPGSKIIYGESIPGLDAKMRYFKPLRVALYQSVVSALREFAPDTTAYFCMEDDDVWEQTFGYRPGDRGGLSAMLDTAAARVCGLQGPIEKRSNVQG